MWAILAILGALLTSIYHVSIKKILKDVDQYVLATGIFLICSLILFFFSVIKGIPEIGSAFYLSVLITVVINIIGITFCFKAFRLTDLSLCVPMLAFTPVFLIFTSFIFLKEVPSIFGGAGIILIVAGSYILNFNKEKINFFEPFKAIFRNKGTFYMLVIALLYSVSVNFDKLVVLNSDPIFGSSVVCFLLGVSFLVISSIKKRGNREVYKKNFGKFFLIGFSIALVSIAINIAYTMQIASYVISLKRLSILFGILFGGLIFKERHIPQRILAALVMLVGAIFIILFN